MIEEFEVEDIEEIVDCNDILPISNQQKPEPTKKEITLIFFAEEHKVHIFACTGNHSNLNNIVINSMSNGLSNHKENELYEMIYDEEGSVRLRTIEPQYIPNLYAEYEVYAIFCGIML